MAKNSVCFRFPERVRTTSKDKCYDVRKNRGLILLSAILVLWTMSVFSSWCFAKDRTEKDGDSLLSTFVADGMPQEILFAVRKPSFDGHWYANFGFYSLDEKKYTFPRNSGGKLCIYNTQTKKIRTIFEDTQGNIRDPQLHYDGRRIVFSYLPAGKCHYSLFTINIDGTGLKQLTGLEKECLVNNVSGQPIQRTCGWDDIEPTWLPDDQIIFCSSRCNRYVQCWLTQVATLHKCNADGSNVRQLSCNVEHDNTPWVLSNGQIAYMRWEYIDRNHLMFHHLWTMNPNGTRQMVLFGNQKPGGVFLDPKPIPNSNKIIFVYSPGHGKKEHYGRLALFDPLYGPDSEKGLEFVTEKNDYTDPWPFSDSSFLAVCKTKVVLIDRDGREETLFQLPAELIKQGFWIGEPRPVTKRDREPIIADTIDPASDHGSFILTNIYQGRKMQEVRPGSIKELLIYESLPKPINYSGAMSEISSGGTFAVTRLLGRVEVPADGCVSFEVPPLRSVFFVALDEKGHCVKRMHSFTSVMPGEVTACIGCHEDRLEAPSAEDGKRLLKQLRRPASQLQPVAGIPEIIDFQRDIQPVLDRYCLECHNPVRSDGNFNISGHWGPLYTLGYQQMSWRNLLGDNRVILPYGQHSKSNFKPYEIGSGSARLLKLIEENHEGVHMPPEEQRLIRFWLDAGAAYAGTYSCNSWGTIGHYDMNTNTRDDQNWPEAKAMEDVLIRRCDSCHAPTEKDKSIGTYKNPAQFYTQYYPAETFQKNMYIARSMSQDGGRFNRHEIFDLSCPELSKIAQAPLAKEAGGLGKCQLKSGVPVFKNKDDPDYKKIIAAVQRGRKFILEECNRFCMSYPSVNNGPDCPVRFVPRPEYIREMIRYGVLPKDTKYDTPQNPFELERKYWQSLWYKPVSNK